MSNKEKEKKGRNPSGSFINLVCEECQQNFTIEGSYDPTLWSLRLKYAKCPHCGHERTEETVSEGYFRCNTDNVIYKRTEHWFPIKGDCKNCYHKRDMRKRRSEEDGGDSK